MWEIATIRLMRDLQREYRITARSIPEVIGPMERALARYGESRRVKFRGRKLSNEAFINAAILHMLDLSESEQEAALSSSLARLEAILADDPAERADDPVVPQDVAGVVEDAEEEVAPKRRSRKGAG